MNNNRGRRSMLSGFGAALAAFALRPTSAQAQSAAGAQPFQPAHHAQDEWAGDARSTAPSADARPSRVGILTVIPPS
jgi:hypothetical protein